MSYLPKRAQKKDLENRSVGIFIWLLVGILLVMLVGGGLTLAAYLGFIPMDDIIYKARQLPIIGKYYLHKIDATLIADETVASVQQTQSVPMDANAAVPPKPVPMDANAAAMPSKPVIQQPLVKNNITDILAKDKAEELKNISRLARLYASMKPEESVPILNDLDDAFVVNMLRKMEDEQAAKILVMMDPQRAAKLSRMLGSANETGVNSLTN
jgi:flagellar protein FlbB